jgi:hypothetical protein
MRKILFILTLTFSFCSLSFSSKCPSVSRLKQILSNNGILELEGSNLQRIMSEHSGYFNFIYDDEDYVVEIKTISNLKKIFKTLGINISNAIIIENGTIVPTLSILNLVNKDGLFDQKHILLNNDFNKNKICICNYRYKIDISYNNKLFSSETSTLTLRRSPANSKKTTLRVLNDFLGSNGTGAEISKIIFDFAEGEFAEKGSVLTSSIGKKLKTYEEYRLLNKSEIGDAIVDYL